MKINILVEASKEIRIIKVGRKGEVCSQCAWMRSECGAVRNGVARRRAGSARTKTKGMHAKSMGLHVASIAVLLAFPSPGVSVMPFGAPPIGVKSLVIEGEEHEILHAERADSSRERGG